MTLKQVIESVIGDLWNNSEIYNNVTYVVDNYGNRFMGTESEEKTKNYLVELFGDYGLENVREESYNYTCWKRGECAVCMVSPVERKIISFALPHSGSTDLEGLEAEVIDLGKGTKNDFLDNSEDIPGKIVMVTTGWPPGQNIHRTTKYGWTIDYGGVGFIYRNETPGQLIETGTVATGYRNTGEIPAIGVSFETGGFIERQMEKSPVILKMKISNDVQPNTTSWNVIGDIIGKEQPEKTILLGAHYDGHDISQEAAGDNLLGTMVMADVARGLSKHQGSFGKTVRFVAFGNEECWTTGSVNYVAAHENELKDHEIMINGDGLGRRRNPVISVYNPQELVGPLRSLVNDWGLDSTVLRSPMLAPSTSDNHPFYMKGVPTISCSGRPPVGWTAGRGRDNHTTADTVDKIDPTIIKESAVLVARLLVALSETKDPLAPRYTSEETHEELNSLNFIEVLKAQRRWHPESVLGK